MTSSEAIDLLCEAIRVSIPPYWFMASDGEFQCRFNMQTSHGIPDMPSMHLNIEPGFTTDYGQNRRFYTSLPIRFDIEVENYQGGRHVDTLRLPEAQNRRLIAAFMEAAYLDMDVTRVLDPVEGSLHYCLGMRLALSTRAEMFVRVPPPRWGRNSLRDAPDDAVHAFMAVALARATPFMDEQPAMEMWDRKLRRPFRIARGLSEPAVLWPAAQGSIAGSATPRIVCLNVAHEFGGTHVYAPQTRTDLDALVEAREVPDAPSVAPVRPAPAVPEPEPVTPRLKRRGSILGAPSRRLQV